MKGFKKPGKETYWKISEIYLTDHRVAGLQLTVLIFSWETKAAHDAGEQMLASFKVTFTGSVVGLIVDTDKLNKAVIKELVKQEEWQGTAEV